MRRVQLRPVIACSAILLVGCGQTAKKHERDPNYITVDEAPLELARTICLRAYDCCTPAQLMPNMSAGSDEATCESESTILFRNQLSIVANSEKLGRLAYRGDRMSACLARIRGATCQDLNRTNHLSGLDCGEPYLEPLVDAGGACAFDAECIAGSCVKADGAPEGICVQRARANQSCADAAPCDRGLYCDDADHLCKPRLPDGAACAAAKQCASGGCDTAAGAGSCGPPKATMCFYSSSCAAAGPATPSVTTVLAGLLVLALTARRKRALARRPPR